MHAWYVRGVILEVDTDFAQLILQLRVDLGLSQSDAARRAGISQSDWSRAERGIYRHLPHKMAVAMLRGLGYTVELSFKG
jgi:transcriptional regulator with XRE-family HTH domain